MNNMLDFDRQGLEQWFESLGEKPFRARQLMKWLYHRKVADFAVMTDLSKGLRRHLSSKARVTVPELARQQLADDGVRKYLFRLADGNAVETVFIPEADRGTLCISSQAGCTLNCTFCATARQGFNRNLETSEIIGQLWAVDRLLDQEFLPAMTSPAAVRAARVGSERITNVVMMGMGEPLYNYDNVVAAMRLMLDDFGFGLSRRRVTLSTAGVTPMIDRLATECSVSLAVSLHAADDELRTRLVPLNRKYPLQGLIAACRRYVVGEARRAVTFEYIMLEGVNDSLLQATKLARLLAGVPAKVNLIPFNPFENSGFRCSSVATIDCFREQLLRHGIMTITRKTRGQNIAAACGQLAGEVLDRTRRLPRIEKMAASFQ
ncbi:MAG TPA: 23S rRNA (adenine(2503)-C(2))-methyltransferase RlmN [Gammaproteobacteria bacterium]|nr:23S rRNA (adenine(2503)-C(2))-methyltransferase RlmN [Gammaproteobacteria bacterium]